MAAPVQTKVTPEEYLELERKATHKSEYRHGEIVAMSGASLCTISLGESDCCAAFLPEEERMHGAAQRYEGVCS